MVSLGRMEDFTIDQFAGATALILGSVGGLLMIIWKSRCACRCRIGCSDKCYLFDCERSPPPDNDSDDEKSDNKQDKILKKEKKILKKENEILQRQQSQDLEPQSQSPEPQGSSVEIEKLI